MAARTEPPYKAQNPDEVGHMVAVLQQHKGYGKRSKDKFSCKSSEYPVQGSSVRVTSWKMEDWDYKKANLPTYARGLFTYENANGQHVIASRGYDKFFNHGEIRKTEWRNVETNTIGPYELSVKENGCIIFISGLEDGTLLVCSKHSTGPGKDSAKSHALTGEAWVDKHMAAVGKTRQDLARKLYEMNATAVAELCDDEFEEHVLAYTPEQAGLYLHGINLNLPEFVTYPAKLVDAFAEEWGLKKTMHLVEHDIKRVKAFLDDIAETGAYAGRDTEGFVIRCRARDSEHGPYADWFFKYKFEEPYLMYRQWRECTKALIGGKEPLYKKHRIITQEYLKFARQKLINDPELGKLYNQNHGIIKLRDEFLETVGLNGAEIIKSEQKEQEDAHAKSTRDVVLVPVATIGCGKTTISLALTKLFGWGHIQNDNITGKARPPRFAHQICESLLEHPVVIADRNNHQKRERSQLIEDVSKRIMHPKFVALHFVHDPQEFDSIRQTMRERIFARGDRHQTIHAGSQKRDEILQIMEGFMQRFEPLDTSCSPDEFFDHIIDLNVKLSSRENLERVVKALKARYPHLLTSTPTQEELDNAIEWAMTSYDPVIKHKVADGNKHYQLNQKQQPAPKQTPKVKPPKIEYFGATLPYGRIISILEAIFRDVDTNTAKTYGQLQQMRRIQQEFHVTLIHRTAAAKNEFYWKQLEDLHNKTGSGTTPAVIGKVRVLLERVLWNERLMTFVVRLAQVKAEPGAEADPVEFRTVNPVAHITVGTADPSIKPKESSDLLEKWTKHGLAPATDIQEVMVKGNVELLADVHAVLSKF